MGGQVLERLGDLAFAPGLPLMQAGVNPGVAGAVGLAGTATGAIGLATALEQRPPFTAPEQRPKP